MEYRKVILNRHLKNHDPHLYVVGRDGIYEIWRRGFRDSHYILSLTHNWNRTGRPVEWGIEPIIARLKTIDLWNGRDIVSELHRNYERARELDDRAFRNEAEAMFSDFRRQFARATDGVNTSTLDKGAKLKWQS